MTTFPSNPSVGDMHVHGAETYVYNGENWVASWGINVPFDTPFDIVSNYLEPFPAITGLVWHNPTTNVIKKYNGSSWDTVGTIGA